MSTFGFLLEGFGACIRVEIRSNFLVTSHGIVFQNIGQITNESRITAIDQHGRIDVGWHSLDEISENHFIHNLSIGGTVRRHDVQVVVEATPMTGKLNKDHVLGFGYLGHFGKGRQDILLGRWLTRSTIIIQNGNVLLLKATVSS